MWKPNAAADASAGKKAKPSAGGAASKRGKRRSMMPSRQERRRMMELQQEEKTRKSTVKIQSVLAQLNDKELFGSDDDSSDNSADEEAPLNDTGEGAANGYGALSASVVKDMKENNEPKRPVRASFFGTLFSGGNGMANLTPDQIGEISSSDDEENPLEGDDRLSDLSTMSVEEQKQAYHDRNEAYLKQTEAERKALLQKNRREELGSTVIPLVRLKLSSLESIPSCGNLGAFNEDEEEEESSDDEPVPSAAGFDALPEKAKISNRDRTMIQERLRVEEEEYNLRMQPKGKSESEKLMGVFRGVAVAVVVAFILWIIVAMS